MGKIAIYLFVAFLVLAVIYFLLEICIMRPARKRAGLSSQQARRRATVSMEVNEVPDYPYSIKGINYADIDDSFLGDFFGYVRALKSNRHDPHAVGVYVKNRRVGFLPKCDAQLHARIMALGGSVGAEGYIAKGTGDDGHVFYYGKLDIIWP